MAKGGFQFYPRCRGIQRCKSSTNITALLCRFSKGECCQCSMLQCLLLPTLKIGMPNQFLALSSSNRCINFVSTVCTKAGMSPNVEFADVTITIALILFKLQSVSGIHDHVHNLYGKMAVKWRCGRSKKPMSNLKLKDALNHLDVFKSVSRRIFHSMQLMIKYFVRSWSIPLPGDVRARFTQN